MNDFTKDELEEIAEMMRHARKQGIETTHNLSYQVEEKAWRMIENYCEHEYIENPNNNEYMLCSMCGDTFQC